jgi:ribonuclease P protein component
MLPRSRRLSRADFDIVRKSALVVSNLIASLRFSGYSGALSGRFSVVVPKTVDARAVVRNTWRRRVYSIIEHASDTKGFDGIFYIRKTTKEISYQNLTRDIQDLLSQAAKRVKQLGLEG